MERIDEVLIKLEELTIARKIEEAKALYKENYHLFQELDVEFHKRLNQPEEKSRPLLPFSASKSPFKYYR